MASVTGLLHSLPLLEVCFDASERAPGGVTGSPEGIAARLAAKAAAVELLDGTAVWETLLAGGGPPGAVCTRMRSVAVRRHPAGIRATQGPPFLDLLYDTAGKRGPERSLCVSMSHDAGLAAALVVDASGAPEQ